MTSQSGRGLVSYPGVTGDGLTPGGEIIAGALTAGDPNAVSVPSTSLFHGAGVFTESPANQIDGDDVLDINQTAPLTQNNTRWGLFIERDAPLNGFDYTRPVAQVDDNTASTAPVFRASKQGVTQFQVDGDGVQVHGKFKTGASVAHVCAVLSGNAVPIYNESGTILGYAPLYN